jgi:hypothetical protein
MLGALHAVVPPRVFAHHNFQPVLFDTALLQWCSFSNFSQRRYFTRRVEAIFLDLSQKQLLVVEKDEMPIKHFSTFFNIFSFIFLPYLVTRGLTASPLQPLAIVHQSYHCVTVPGRALGHRPVAAPHLHASSLLRTHASPSSMPAISFTPMPSSLPWLTSALSSLCPARPGPPAPGQKDPDPCYVKGN